jgi:CheY-like chemotaxis protein
VARRLRATERGSRVRLVALTGYGDDDDVARARGAGFDLFLVNPVSFSSLSAVLEMPSGVAPLEEH